MNLSPTGVAALTDHEGVRLSMYRDPIGLPSIGIGHCLTKDELSSGKLELGESGCVRWANGLTHAQVERLLRRDLAPIEAAVTDAVKVPLKQHQFDALVSLCFNIGPTAFRQSTLVRRLNLGEYDVVPLQLRRWVYAGGKRLPLLVARREAEARLWEGRTA